MPAEKRECPNQAYLLDLINQCNPEFFVNYDFRFSEEFYEGLTSVLSIRQLNLGGKLNFFNFDLFLKLKYLRELSIYTNRIPLEFISKIFKLKYFYHLSFGLSSSHFTVLRRPEGYTLLVIHENRTGISDICEAEQCFESMEDLINGLEKYRKTNLCYLREYLT